MTWTSLRPPHAPRQVEGIRACAHQLTNSLPIATRALQPGGCMRGSRRSDNGRVLLAPPASLQSSLHSDLRTRATSPCPDLKRPPAACISQSAPCTGVRHTKFPLLSGPKRWVRESSRQTWRKSVYISFLLARASATTPPSGSESRGLQSVTRS